MEALVILLAELLSGPIIAAFFVLTEVALFLVGFLVDLVSWLIWRRRKATTAPDAANAPETTTARKATMSSGARQTEQCQPRNSNIPRRVRMIALAGLALSIGSLLVMNFVLFESVARWGVAQAARRTHTEIDFKSASGNIFSGTIVFEELSARRVSETRSSFDLKARRLSADIDLWTLVFRPIRFQSLVVETVSGTLRRPERSKTAGGGDGDDKIRAKRRFDVQDLTLKDVNIMFSKGDNAPVAVALTSVSSTSFRSNYALFDTLFRSNLNGRIDGRAIVITTRQADHERRTEWRMPDLQAATVSRLVSRPPLGWLREGTLDIHVGGGWPLGANADIGMDWAIRTQGVRAQAREGASLMEKTVALPVTGYINGKDGNVDLRFKLVINEHQFENMSSLDAPFLWDVVLQSMAKSVGTGTGDHPGPIRQGAGRAIEGFKGFLDRRRKPAKVE